MKTNLKSIALFSVLALVLFSLTFVSAIPRVSTGWQDLRTKNDYYVCGDAYPTCTLSKLGVNWFQPNSGSPNRYEMICGEIPEVGRTDCLLWGGASVGRSLSYLNIPDGRYYLMIKAYYGYHSADNDETMTGGIGSDYGNNGRNIIDLGTGNKRCIFKNTFGINDNKKFWLTGTGGSVNPYAFKLISCIPNQTGLVYCEDGTPIQPNCDETNPPNNDTNQTGTIPIIYIDSPTSRTYNHTNIPLRVSANQYIVTWKYNLNNQGNVTFTPNITITAREGANTLIVYGINANGTGFDYVNFNVNTSQPINQTHSPNVNIISPNLAFYNYSNILINISASDIDGDLNRVWFNINNGNNETYANSFFRNFSDGTYTIRAYANDSNNNIASDSWTFIVNSTAPNNQTGTIPVIDIDSPTSRTYNHTNIPLRVSANQYIVTWKYNLNNAGNITFTPNTTITAREGLNTLIVYGINANGTGFDYVNFNVNTSQGNETNITAPIITIFNPENNHNYTNSTINLNVGANQPIDNWIYNLNNAGNITFTPNTTITAIEGLNTLIVYGINANGTGFDTVNFNVNTTQAPDDDDDDDNDDEDNNNHCEITRASTLDSDSGVLVLSKKCKIDLSLEKKFNWRKYIYWLFPILLIILIIIVLVWIIREI